MRHQFFINTIGFHIGPQIHRCDNIPMTTATAFISRPALFRNFIAGLLSLLFLPLFGAQVVYQIDLKLPDSIKVQKAIAHQPQTGLDTPGRIEDQTIHFDPLLPTVPYDLSLTLADGTELVGVNMNWYDLLPPDEPAAEPMTDEDLAAINTITSKVPAFYTSQEVLQLKGDHRRAVALVQLIRDTAFHASKDGEVIWRVELWYFQFEAGGWEKIAQQNRVLRRERFVTHAAYEQVISKVKWVPALGGIMLGKDQPQLEITLPDASATQPAEHPQKTNPPAPDPSPAAGNS